MIFHVVALDDWLAGPERPFAPPALARDGCIRCCSDEARALEIAGRDFTDVTGPLMTLLIDEHRLDARVRWEPEPHVYGRINRTAVTGMLEIERDAEGRPRSHAVWS
ncbi:DUF952 domain-containing protein [Streptomyces sp. HNM0574]|uniref:DUF952 domain-containing protein n=1 Tax=Streptomyces sp. HNM0574 TaxID=2714954 RepID=UPI00146AAB77|nr:DUF952 domain-containing protein [Streptomyces sp. HNM0574]NLU69069.1 DUF952 domain-containing protein [Streptomyces sp. HNM0574]